MFKSSVEFKCLPLQISAIFFFNGATVPSGPEPPHYRDFAITVRHTTLSITPLDKWSARRRQLYLTTHNSDKRERERERHPCPRGIRTHNPSKREAADPRLRPRGHWDRQISALLCLNTHSLVSRNMTSCFLESKTALFQRRTMPLSDLTFLRQRLWWLFCGRWCRVVSQITLFTCETEMDFSYYLLTYLLHGAESFLSS